ncbi:lipopolysaccharide transport periplasmic protein LptA [Psychromonas sp. PT13]|uniref:lipopolysaccharide transport periplasmic protein LptA n=1 Tax=Psychromonas sp. PT13 TaxID=3439547 RepID=UPI003EB8548C
MKINKILFAVSTLLVSFSSNAIESDYSQPIHVSSLQQHAKMAENKVIFSKEVLLTQGTIKITSNTLTVERDTKINSEKMTAEGLPATFYQTQNDGRPLTAKANYISYNVAEGKITLSGSAQVKQLDSEINASKIVYFLKTKELIVGTGESNKDRVNTVFLPSQFEKTKQDTTNSNKEE